MTSEAQFVSFKCWTTFTKWESEIGSKSEKNTELKEESKE